MKPTTEELMLQILATCMLINTQGIYLVALNYGCGNSLWVTVEPRVGLDEDEEEAYYSASVSEPDQPDYDQADYDRAPVKGVGTLTGMLSNLQGYLQREATPCAA